MQFYKGTKIPILQFDDINRLLRLDSNNLKFHSYMALFYYEQGDTNSALHIYENILQKESYNVDALKSIGTINFVRNKIKIAKSYYEKCIQYDPTDGEVFMAMASILDKEKKPDRSCDCLLKAVDLGDREAMKHIYKCEEYLRKKGIGIKIDKDTINNTTTVQKTTEI